MEMSTLFLGSLTEVEKNDAEDAIGLLLVLLWLALRPRDSGLANYRLWFWSSLAGLGVSGNFAFYFVSIAQGSVAVAATLMYSAPGFVYLASFALKLERPNAVKWTAIAVVMTGIVLLTQICDVNESRVTVAGIGPGLLAGISYAVLIFGFKYAPPPWQPPGDSLNRLCGTRRDPCMDGRCRSDHCRLEHSGLASVHKPGCARRGFVLRSLYNRTELYDAGGGFNYGDGGTGYRVIVRRRGSTGTPDRFGDCRYGTYPGHR